LRIELLSIGIDVGTTTFHYVVNKLFVERKAAVRGLPRYELRGFEEVCQSPIFLTPYTARERQIDEEGILRLITGDFERTALSPAEIQTGSVIVTGEAAKKANADRIIASLSALFENLVSTVAGPKLESLLAAKGAQVDVSSRNLFKTIVNIDIGGGTSNIAVFRNGKSIGFACLWIGGRMVRLDANGRVRGMTEIAGEIWREEGLPSEVEQAGIVEVERFADVIAQRLMDFVHSGRIPECLVEFDDLPSGSWSYDAISFTGGVGQVMHQPACYGGDRLRFSDIGVILAEKLLEKCPADKLHIPPIEGIRATAIGVGVSNIQLSGSTVFVSDPSILPLRNVPAVSLEIDSFDATAVSNGIALLEAPFADEHYLAYCFNIKGVLRFDDLAQLSNLIIERTRQSGRDAIVVVFNKDIGKIFGYHAANACRGVFDVRIVSVDGIELDDNTYLDFGAFLPGGALPVTAKTLYF
jgi:ethanolamine utilization protein EutA